MLQRKNVYTLPAGDTTLEWYGKAVLEMQKRPTTDPTSWNFQAAVHGFNASLPYWGDPNPLPPQNIRDQYWDRCQHASWYFLPWHRMYLAYFEQIVAQTIVDLGGPAGWALPFWNYSEQNASGYNPLAMPPAFTSPADTSNGLWINGRSSNSVRARNVTLEMLNLIPFTGDGKTGGYGFGGRVTVFNHGGGPFGGLESKPHNPVHVDIGGAMGIPSSAGLDPIFWLHHANIDRLWQVWLNMEGGRANTNDDRWLNYSFKFHDSSGNPVEMSVKDVEDTTQVLGGYTYEGVPAEVATPEVMMARGIDDQKVARPLEVVGASNQSQVLSSSHSSTMLNLVADKKTNEVASRSAEPPAPPTTYLHFENITGKGVPPVYDVYLNSSDKDDFSDDTYAGSLAFFGIEEASTSGLHHAGSGQHYVLDVTNLLQKFRESEGWQDDQLKVHLKPAGELANNASVAIGRISLYSQ